MPPGGGGENSSSQAVKEFLDKTLVARGTDPVTGAADLCAHVRIAPALRNAALNLVGADLYKKVKPPGDTSLHTNNAWSLESLAPVKPTGATAPAVDPATLAAACSLPPGRHVLPEEAKGPRVVPISQR